MRVCARGRVNKTTHQSTPNLARVKAKRRVSVLAQSVQPNWLSQSLAEEAESALASPIIWSGYSSQESAMKTMQPAYLAAYSGLKMSRDAQGVLVVSTHLQTAVRGKISRLHRFHSTLLARVTAPNDWRCQR